ncbi:hypothetical protein KI387_013727, partial [Taxus chinensis]
KLSWIERSDEALTARIRSKKRKKGACFVGQLSWTERSDEGLTAQLYCLASSSTKSSYWAED